jgi:putative transposase
MTSNERYRKGAHTVTELQYHFVWKTKYSYPVLVGDVALRVRSLIQEICKENEMIPIRGNVRSNHVHVLISAPTYLSPGKIAQYLKGKSSFRLMREFSELRKRYWGSHLWGRGYFCSTVGAVTEEIIKKYIENQMDGPGAFKVWDERNIGDEGSPLGS